MNHDGHGDTAKNRVNHGGHGEHGENQERVFPVCPVLPGVYAFAFRRVAVPAVVKGIPNAA